MTTRYVLAAGAWMVLTLLQPGSSAGPAQAQPASALTGQVTSAEEGPMEGVLVSVKKAGSTITTTVVTDQQGRYRFPGPRLTPGPYAISIRAVGYELDRPNVADVGANGPVTADLRLRKARDLAAQLTNAECLARMPGTEDPRKALLGCVNCHTLERVLRTSYDAAGFLQVQQRMGTYVNQSTPLHIQLRRAERLMEMRGDERQRARQALAEFLSGVNLNGRPSWPYELRTLPRPTGRSTCVVITESDLPRPTIQPHDVIVDPDGAAWYCNFGEQTLGKLDPRTGRVTEYRVPELKPGFPTGALSVRFDRDSNLWLGMMLQVEHVSFLRSNFAMPPWNIMPRPRVLSGSKRTDKAPVGKPGFSSGTRYSVTRPVLGSSLPSVCSPKLQYQAMPSGSTMTSCGWIVARGRSYSVMTTRVPRPVGRGSVFSSYGHVEPPMRLTVLRNSARACRARWRSSPRISSSRSARRTWMCSGVLWFT